MSKSSLFVFCTFYFSFPASIVPGIIHIPADQPTIQAGINSAADGDTVLVAEETYYENINFRGKAITVASQFIMDGDTNHIRLTVINGSQPSHPDSGSVVCFVSGEDTTSILSGFTITGGTGTFDPTPARAGGGINCWYSGAKITHNIIEYNSVSYSGIAAGGGVSTSPPGNTFWIVLDKNVIRWNTVEGTAGGGGGFLIGNARVVDNLIEHNTATNFQAGGVGGGLILSPGEAWPGMLPFERVIIGNTIRYNKAIAPTSIGGDGGIGGGLGVSYPGAIICNNNISYNEVQGNDSLNSCFGGGVFLGNQTSETIFANNVVSFNRVLDNFWSNGAGIIIWSTDIPSRPLLLNNTISDNTGSTWGGGIFIGGWQNVNVRPSVIGNMICNNEGLYGGAIWCEKSLVLENNLITDNHSEFGGGIGLWGTGELAALNNTIVANGATSNGGGMVVWADVRVFMMNNILWNNFPGGQIYNESTIPGQYHYNNIQGGWPGIGNIDIDPQFADTLFHLLPNSYCIGLGRSSITVGDSIYQAPLFDLEVNPRPNPIDTLVDMGAYETPFPGRAQLVSSRVNQSQCYLNPSRDSVRIRVFIINPHQQSVSLGVQMSNLQGAVWDETTLYDDGQHSDSLAGDNFYGAILPPVILEDAFRINYWLVNNAFQDTMIYQEGQQITSIGPLICEDYHILSQNGNRIQLQLVLRNLGQSSTATEVRAKLIPLDSSVTGVISNNRSFGNITAGSAAVNSSAYLIDIMENTGILTFDVRISMGGYPYWLQENLVVGIEARSPRLPGEFALYQNYPNPFNASTNIEFRNPKKGFVTLKIFNILGEEVATLLSASLLAGFHSYEFDASDLANGIYVYRLRTGNFVESRKMLLLK